MAPGLLFKRHMSHPRFTGGPAVLFGLLILSIIVTTALCFWMRFGRWASLLVAITWFFTALVMLGGVGEYQTGEGGDMGGTWLRYV